MLVPIVAALFSLFSPQFVGGGSLAGEFVWNHDGCRGANRSPALRWTQPPAQTKGFALGVYDPDAGPAGWWHWIVYNIPVERRGLSAALAPSASGLNQGLNDFGTIGYAGPCPPPGPAHHYAFTLYALDIARLAAAPPIRGRVFVALLRRHIIGTATITGIYGR